MIVDIQSQCPPEIIFHQLAQSGLSMHSAFRCADDVVAVGEEPSEIGGRRWGDLEDVPDIFREGERGILQCQAEGRRGARDRDGERPSALTLFVHHVSRVTWIRRRRVCEEETDLGAPESQSHVATSTIANFSSEEVRIGAVLLAG